jgi:hypothetical protein
MPDEDKREEFVVTVGLKDVGTYSTFKEAFHCFYHAINTALKDGTIAAWQVLETACFIELRVGGTPSLVWNFAGAKEQAYHLGLMTEEGRLIENGEEES